MADRIRHWLNIHGPERDGGVWRCWPDDPAVIPGLHPGLRFRPRQIIGGRTWSLTLCTHMADEISEAKAKEAASGG